MFVVSVSSSQTSGRSLVSHNSGKFHSLSAHRITCFCNLISPCLPLVSLAGCALLPCLSPLLSLKGSLCPSSSLLACVFSASAAISSLSLSPRLPLVSLLEYFPPHLPISPRRLLSASAAISFISPRLPLVSLIGYSPPHLPISPRRLLSTSLPQSHLSLL